MFYPPYGFKTDDYTMSRIDMLNLYFGRCAFMKTQQNLSIFTKLELKQQTVSRIALLLSQNNLDY